jgi:hypothetical protein
MERNQIVLSLINKSHTIGFLLIGLLIVLPACTHQTIHQVGSHKVTIARHGFQKKLEVDKQAGTFEYAGVSAAGRDLKVSIVGDKVKINGSNVGKLRPGDSVLIGDSGVAVNSLDYGESEKYLRANGSTSDATVTN